MRRLNALGSAGRHLRLGSVAGGLPLRPRASRPSPSHRCAAGPSLYKRGCLRLRNSPAASKPAPSGPSHLPVPVSVSVGGHHARYCLPPPLPRKGAQN